MKDPRPYGDLLVKTLALDNRSAALGLDGVSHDALVVQLPGFGPQGPFSGLVVAVIDIAVLCCGHTIPVLLRQNLSILDRLDGAVVMVLVDLFVDGSTDNFMPGRLDCLVFYGRSNLLIDASIVMSSLGHVLSSLLGLVHNDVRKWIWDEV